ncbi:MAG TPA: superoxide dismutase family protein [Burkholderiales bacterium]|nr:superoxide dismutase family protein [Burkholderiales bacterium]
MKKHAISIVCCALFVGGCAEMDVAKNPTATVTLEPLGGSNVRGDLTFTQVGDVVRITGLVSGHSKGPKGFHIHETGDCSDPKGMSAGGHYNPGKHKHGGPYEAEKHAGDLGNITFGDDGTARINFTVGDISVSRGTSNGIIGKAVIVHAAADDLMTDPTGNSGGRVACGVIK